MYRYCIISINLHCIPLLALSGGSMESMDAAKVAEEFQED